MGKGSPLQPEKLTRAALAFTAHGEQLGADRKSATMTHFTICDKANCAINHHGECPSRPLHSGLQRCEPSIHEYEGNTRQNGQGEESNQKGMQRRAS